MINCSTYFFEESKRGYFQYPHDYAADFFKSYRNHFSSDALLVAHRQPNLMYYTYMKKLSDDKGGSFFGMSVVLNGIETNNIRSLFKLFERVFQQIVSEGEIITINSEGEFVLNNIDFSASSKVFDKYSTSIKGYIEKGAGFFFPMFPVNYSSSEDDFSMVSVSDDDKTIRQYLSDNNKLFITKDHKSSTPELNGLAVRIQNLCDQIEFLKKRNAELENNNTGKSFLRWRAIAISCLTALFVVLLVIIYCFSCGLVFFNH